MLKKRTRVWKTKPAKVEKPADTHEPLRKYFTLHAPKDTKITNWRMSE